MNKVRYICDCFRTTSYNPSEKCSYCKTVPYIKVKDLVKEGYFFYWLTESDME